jgi:hypothetical protein
MWRLAVGTGQQRRQLVTASACDARNRVCVVWSQQVAENWDIYARSFDPARQEWSGLERLSSDPFPDINPRMASDGNGRLAVAWQGFRSNHSGVSAGVSANVSANIFVKTFDGNRWSDDVRVTRTAANDWEPAVAFDSNGTIWVAYDSYRNGNDDVFLSRISGGKVDGGEMEVWPPALFSRRVRPSRSIGTIACGWRGRRAAGTGEKIRDTRFGTCRLEPRSAE